MRKETVGLALLVILALYGAASVSWYLPTSGIPAIVFAVFPIIGTIGVMFIAYKKGDV